tara:strand:- start:1474 stop:1671 length:198 start_codon:yes stop_codon:yes gene_type:complete
MIGKLIGGTFKVLMRIISVIPFIGAPLVRFICFFVENFIKAVRNLFIVICVALAIFVVLTLLGVI